MADAKKCDICGKFYEYYKGVKLDNNGRILNGCKIRFVSDDNVVQNSADLCRECMIKVRTLLASIADEKERVI